MITTERENRIKALYRMLLNFINGDLTNRLPFDTEDKQFNEIAKSLNDVAGKLQLANYENPFNSRKVIMTSDINEPAILILKVQEYILTHLHEDLPSSKELAQMFGTNEFTLKQSFRNLSKTSIYQFYNDERLKKAHLLIQQTTIPLVNVAVLSGFSNYANFFKAFKKKYASTPSKIIRPSSLENP